MLNRFIFIITVLLVVTGCTTNYDQTYLLVRNQPQKEGFAVIFGKQCADNRPIIVRNLETGKRIRINGYGAMTVANRDYTDAFAGQIPAGTYALLGIHTTASQGGLLENRSTHPFVFTVGRNEVVYIGTMLQPWLTMFSSQKKDVDQAELKMTKCMMSFAGQKPYSIANYKRYMNLYKELITESEGYNIAVFDDVNNAYEQIRKVYPQVDFSTYKKSLMKASAERISFVD